MTGKERKKCDRIAMEEQLTGLGTAGYVYIFAPVSISKYDDNSKGNSQDRTFACGWHEHVGVCKFFSLDGQTFFLFCQSHVMCMKDELPFPNADTSTRKQ